MSKVGKMYQPTIELPFPPRTQKQELKAGIWGQKEIGWCFYERANRGQEQETLNPYTSELLWQLFGKSLTCQGLCYFYCNKLCLPLPCMWIYLWTSWDNESHSSHLHCNARELKIYIHIKLIYSLHYSIIHNSQNIETTQKLIPW